MTTSLHPVSPNARRRHARRARRGAMLFLICALMIVFVALTALSVDVAYMHLTRTQLRAATDAAARGGGEALSRLQSTDAAREAANQMAQMNLVAGKPLLLDKKDITFGFSDVNPDGAWTFKPHGKPTNSLQVLGRRTAKSPSGSVGLFFGKALGVYEFEPTQTATAVKLDRDICLVLDRSSSMKLSLSSTAETMSTSDPRFAAPPTYPDSRWAAATAAVDVFVDTLDTTPQHEYCALVSFASDGSWVGVDNVAASLDQVLTYDSAAVKAAGHSHDSVVFNGMTNTAAGLDAAIAELKNPERARPYARKTVVFLTDGFRTAGGDPVASADVAKASDIVIHTISFGAAFNQAELIAVADATGGKHYHAPDAATLSEIFRAIAASTGVVMTQ